MRPGICLAAQRECFTRASPPTLFLHTPLAWFRPYRYGWSAVREGWRRNFEPLCCALLGVSSRTRRRSDLLPIADDLAALATTFSFSGMSTEQKALRRALESRPPKTLFFTPSGVCRLSFAFACPCAPPSGFDSVSGIGVLDAARRTRGDSTACGQRN